MDNGVRFPDFEVGKNWVKSIKPAPHLRYYNLPLSQQPGSMEIMEDMPFASAMSVHTTTAWKISL